ncbi:MAG TPA: putative molybdenum carrier protein [Desulfopila sp.]|nr:putative molybdenum carrier protein [Desulfopila sp.]
MVRKIISGGQTGVDQAALDAAMEVGVAYGGWLPAGRRTERGPLPQRYYHMQELPTDSYPERTRKNIENADATLIVSRGGLTGGSALTAKIAGEMDKPCLHMDLELSAGCAATHIEQWLCRHQPEILNIAGPRASSDAAIYDQVLALIKEIMHRRGGDRGMSDYAKED